MLLGEFDQHVTLVDQFFGRKKDIELIVWSNKVLLKTEKGLHISIKSDKINLWKGVTASWLVKGEYDDDDVIRFFPYKEKGIKSDTLTEFYPFGQQKATIDFSFFRFFDQIDWYQSHSGRTNVHPTPRHRNSSDGLMLKLDSIMDDLSMTRPLWP